MSVAINNLFRNVAAGRICTALGVKIIPTTEVVYLAKDAGYDSLFIELEHSTFDLKTASHLCTAGLALGITPFVRIPHQAGNGLVQRILDNGAMGVIFPHISSVEEAQEAVAISKFPPFGKRSLTAGLPHFEYRAISAVESMRQLDESGSTVFLMVETKACLESIEKIASLPGVDVLLIGSNDLSLELGVLGQWDSDVFQASLKRVAVAARASGKVFGLAGLYNRPDICGYAIKELWARYILGNLDIGLLGAAAKENARALKELEK